MLFNTLLCKQRIRRVLCFAIPQMMLIMKIQALLQKVAREGRESGPKEHDSLYAIPCDPKGPL